MNQYMVCLKRYGIVQHCILLYYIVPMITGNFKDALWNAFRLALWGPCSNAWCSAWTILDPRRVMTILGFRSFPMGSSILWSFSWGFHWKRFGFCWGTDRAATAAAGLACGSFGWGSCCKGSGRASSWGTPPVTSKYPAIWPPYREGWKNGRLWSFWVISKTKWFLYCLRLVIFNDPLFVLPWFPARYLKQEDSARNAMF